MAPGGPPPLADPRGQWPGHPYRSSISVTFSDLGPAAFTVFRYRSACLPVRTTSSFSVSPMSAGLCLAVRPEQNQSLARLICSVCRSSLPEKSGNRKSAGSRHAERLGPVRVDFCGCGRSGVSVCGCRRVGHWYPPGSPLVLVPIRGPSPHPLWHRDFWGPRRLKSPVWPLECLSGFSPTIRRPLFRSAPAALDWAFRPVRTWAWLDRLVARLR